MTCTPPLPLLLLLLLVDYRANQRAAVTNLHHSSSIGLLLLNNVDGGSRSSLIEETALCVSVCESTRAAVVFAGFNLSTAQWDDLQETLAAV